MSNQVEKLKRLIENLDAFFDARYQHVAEQDGSPAVKLWALSRYGHLHDRIREILSEAVREAEHASGQA